jgi:hypothetical protein
MQATKLRLERCEFTYEGQYAHPAFSLTDAPGKLADLLLGVLSPFRCSGPDLDLDLDEFSDRAVTCEIDELDARLSIYGDRAEFHCSEFPLDGYDDVAHLLNGLWPALALLDARAAPKTISFRFDLDSHIPGGTYQQLLNRLAPPSTALPRGTESAVVFYLPPNPLQGLCDSSLVLNRSELVDQGLQVSATLVYESQTKLPLVTLATAKNRLDDLTQGLGLEWT